MKIAIHIASILYSCLLACTSGSIPHEISRSESLEDTSTESVDAIVAVEPRPGIYTFITEMSTLRGKRIAVVANHTSQIEGVHLVDTLLGSGIEIVRVFAPEHGFRGDIPDGAKVNDEADPKTGVPIVSLYGKLKKPTPEHLRSVDLVVFDIQDVGARFYTFLSTLHNILEACAENNVQVILLDRPNPNIHYVDGPVLDMKFKSFVGMHPVPVVYGMTIGEYALMINGEGWLAGGIRANLEVIQCSDYTRSTKVELRIPPSPNLRNMEAIYLYPSLCFFEGTTVSVGRGTDHPFTVIGEPGNTKGDFAFTPRSIPGISTSPPHLNLPCRGYDLRGTIQSNGIPVSIDVSYLLRMYNETSDRQKFFLKSGFFDLLAGSDRLRKHIESGSGEASIRESWRPDLQKFEKVREKYLIYRE